MDVTVRALTDDDVTAADGIFRIAFGTFLGMPEPARAFGDSEMFRTRWRAPNTSVLGAWHDRRLVGSSVVTRWGSFGFFGPLTVAPELWDQGIAKALLVATEKVFDDWKVGHRGLFTFPQSAKHIALYQRFGYWPQYLTPIFERSVAGATPDREPPRGIRLYSNQVPGGTDDLLRETRELTDRLFPGLDVTGEILSIDGQKSGDTVLLVEEGRLEGFACCHVGAGSETESGTTYAKFACVRPGPHSEDRLTSLLAGVEWLAGVRGETTVELGVNSRHRDTTRVVVDRGYRSDFVGVLMRSPDELGYHRPELFVIDDLR